MDDLFNMLKYGWTSSHQMAEFPYEKYTLYKNFDKEMGRWYVQLVLPGNKERKIMSFARYRMSVHLKRILLETEEVDHIDENKTNDEIDNLQILTKPQNIRKSSKIGQNSILFVCPVCGVQFERVYNQGSRNIRENKTACCSRKCAGIYSHY